MCGGGEKKSIVSVYLKNAAVALISAKHYNVECRVIFATNIIKKDLPKAFIDLLSRNSIDIVHIPFNNFNFNNNYDWSLAFYKLCVLKYLSQTDFENICYLDSDVYVQESLDNVWRECNENIVMYDIVHGLGTPDYNIFCKEIKLYFGQEKLITHYGGEFFAASKDKAMEFVQHLDTIYKRMLDNNIITSRGDEYLISIAAYELKENVKNAAPYIFRFWTGVTFRLVCTCYKYNQVAILHLPSEKNRGMLKIYDKYISKSIIPKNKKVWKICKLCKSSIIDTVKLFIKVHIFQLVGR